VDEITIGARLRTLRRWRGQTQAELAGLAGLSPSFLSMVETGQRPLDRRSHIAALASALKVSETDLVGGPHLSSDRQQSDPHMGIPALRVALQTNTLTAPAVDHARPLADLAQIVIGKLESLRRTSDYATIGDLLPDVLDGLHYHAAVPADEAAQRLALATLVEACVCATFTAKNLNYTDLAHLAARRAGEAAALLDDPIAQGKANFVWLQTLPRAGSLNRNLAAAERAASALEPYARDPVGLSVLGMITLTTSLTAATLQRGDAASHWLDEATAIAARIPDTPACNWQSFSATNASIWRVTVGVERGEAGGAIRELAEQVSLDRLDARSSRRANFLADVGCGLAREPQTRTEAVRWLRRAEETAPQRIRNSTAARESVAYLLNRATAAAGGRELRGMAARMGLPH
jgi:transcriptional regulator with XRE-family HTH domain